MFDFVKIEVSNSVATKWLNCSRLNFTVSVGYNTGDVSTNKLIAKQNGATFTIFYEDESITKIKYTEVTISLHKFKNNGKHNADDFTFMELQKVISDLNELYYIEPETAILRNIEFAVNVPIPIPVRELLKNLVAFRTFEFKSLSDGRKHIGKQIVTGQHRFKIYDKGKQSNLKDIQNLARFEMHYNKMEQMANGYHIKTLADLCDLAKVKPLISEIVKRWEDIIYYDKSINITHLSPAMQRRILYFATPRNWVEYDKKQRYKKRKIFSNYMQKYGSTTHKDITELICEKWDELTAEKRRPFDHPNSENKQHKKGDLLTVRMYGQKVPQTPIKDNTQKSPRNTQKKATKKSPKKRVCKVCKNDISHKRAGAKYCSKKCNNKHNGKMRTKKRQKQRATEIKNLEKLILLIDKGKMWLMISYKTDDGIYTDTLHQHEIRTTPEWVRSVQKVLVTEYRKKAPPIILTSYRARKLIKLINDNNNLKNQNNDNNTKNHGRNNF